MKNLLAISLFFSIAFTAKAQELNQVVFDEESNQKILYGECNTNGFKKSPFSSWYNSEFKGYTPDAAITDSLKPKLESIEFKIIMGTWCSDSQREVPRFIKILQSLDFPLEKVQIICVNSSKTAVEYRVNVGDVELVPTFYIMLEGVEIGRIVETPVNSLEKDLLDILSGKYKPPHAADEV